MSLHVTSSLTCVCCSQPFNEFATSQAIQCTEVYEYATSLSNEPVFMAAFQLYKFLYCVRLVDAGMWEEVSAFDTIRS